MPFIDLGKAPVDEYEAAEFVPHLSSDLGLDPEEVKASAKFDKRSCYNFKGGEKAGLIRLQEYMFSRRAVSKYAATRNDLIGTDYTSKLSPWLANGSISSRKVYWEVKRFERE